MDLKKIKTIDQIIEVLDQIIIDSIKKQDTLGYFAVLYRKVTKKVKQGIEENFFDDGSRMEKLDVIFAKRYLDAYFSYKSKKEITKSWEIAFEFSKDYWPIVLQHLLIGMNAHINLDLGIAAAEVSKNKDINNLKDDFNKINEILSSLVNEVQNDLANIWPKLKWILQKTKKVDDFLVDFSMEIARNEAWEFATTLANKSTSELEKLITEKDTITAKKAKFISNPGAIVSMVLGIIRLGEKGTVSDKIKELKN